MATNKTKTIYFCSNCGADSPKWLGKCPHCGEWNTFVEEKVTSSKGRADRRGTILKSEAKPIPVSQIVAGEQQRISMPSNELNRVLGGGLVPGSITLIGGEPGIGKSTLILQNLLCIRGKKLLYVSGEESATQLKLRADRIGKSPDNTYILCETDLDSIFTHIENVQPDIVIIDSIQTIADEGLDSAAGSVSQVRECAARLLKFAKQTGVPVLLVGHINKEGSIAGPKVLEHIVDTVLHFEGDRQHLYRILRAVKNRFGSTSEIGIYEMVKQGLREVSNPSEMLLSQNRGTDMSGMAIGVTMEGVRPFLVEVQALVSTAAYGMPQRSVTGFDRGRLNMLLAVLEKRVGFKLAQKDVFLNIAGGLKVVDTALDLAVVCAVLSSNFDVAVPPDVAMAGEIGLSGEVRVASHMDRRIAEARKLGFQKIYVPKGSLKGLSPFSDIDVIEISRVTQIFKSLFS